MFTRRRMVAGVGAVAALGFNPVTRVWNSHAKASGLLDSVPKLDGELVLEGSVLATHASDVGHLIEETPLAVLQPGSVQDIQRMIRYCRKRGIKVAARGQGHTTFGQSLAAGGMIVDMGSLAKIHAIETHRAVVDAGTTWKDLCAASVPAGLTPPQLTGYIGLSVGGTLSVGGISSTHSGGAQVDRVQELQIVTGCGEVVECSFRHNRDLFLAALAGLGQCGIITRATIDLVPAPQRVRTALLHYKDNEVFFRDMLALLERNEFEGVLNRWLPDSTGGFVYQLNAHKYLKDGEAPNDAHLLRGLSPDLAEQTQVFERPYIEYILEVDTYVGQLQQQGRWDKVQHPWFDVFLPQQTVKRYVADTLAELSVSDVGTGGFLLLIPQRRSALRRPLLRVPETGDWVFLFDILTAAETPGSNADFAARMLARNRKLFEKARRCAGTRYPIGSLQFSGADWTQHYGPLWESLTEQKRRHDPDGILTPGPGIF